MLETRTKIGRNGRLVIPARHRQALQLNDGDEVIMSVEDGTLHITTQRQAVKELQRLVRRHVPEGVNLADELIQERRAEAERE
jgi:AbrB family looped-hinge helix DNA binding protein